MASIRKSKTAKGYRFYVQIRLEGHPQQSKTFSNLNDAKQWSVIVGFLEQGRDVVLVVFDNLASPDGVEPPVYPLGGDGIIQLCYGDICALQQ